MQASAIATTSSWGPARDLPTWLMTPRIGLNPLVQQEFRPDRAKSTSVYERLPDGVFVHHTRRAEPSAELNHAWMRP